MANRDKFGMDAVVVRTCHSNLEKPIVCRIGTEQAMGNHDRRHIFFKNPFLTIFVLCLVFFNLAFLLRGFMLNSHTSLLTKICDEQLELKREEDTNTINIAFFGKFAYRNMKILRGIDRTIGSILKHTKSMLHLHVLLDWPSRNRVARALKKLMKQHRVKMEINYYDVIEMAETHRDVVNTMRSFFFSKDVGRYSDDIFFMSEIFHRSLPQYLKKLIFLDVDLLFMTDIRDLHEEFNKFQPSNMIGIAPDLQPQYRVDFAKYRLLNTNTKVGSHRPHGRQGFNTGVTLFNLERMRNSTVYNSLLEYTTLKNVCQKYEFSGYLGHQDFYTVTGMEHPELYYDLNCIWNRQLDTSWENEIGSSVFKLYHECQGNVKVYHGNGDSKLPNS